MGRCQLSSAATGDLDERQVVVGSLATFPPTDQLVLDISETQVSDWLLRVATGYISARNNCCTAITIRGTPAWLGVDLLSSLTDSIL